MRTIHFNRQITEALFVRAQKAHYLSQPQSWIAPVIIVLASLWSPYKSDDAVSRSMAADAVITIVPALLLLALLWWLLGRMLRSAYRKVEEMYRGMEGSVGEEGFRYVSADGTLTFPWANLKRAVFLDDGFCLVYRTEGYILILDRRLFASEDDWRAVAGAIAARLPTKARRQVRSFIASLSKTG